jgi:phosphatidylglycerol:prolipoprotein diacylglycerol transferase
VRPILFSWRGVTVWSYPAMLYLGLVAGTLAGNIAANAAGVDARRLFAATLILMTVALIGARLAHVVSNWRVYRVNGRAWDRRDGGYAQDGGIVLALLVSLPLFVALDLPIGASLDAGVFTMLVIPMFARIGCVLHGCCVGRPSTGWFSVRLPDRSGVCEPRVPCQYLEAAWALLLLCLAAAIWPLLAFPGALFLVLTTLYSSGRVVLLSLRDAPSTAYRPALQRAMSAVMIAVPLATLIHLWE